MEFIHREDLNAWLRDIIDNDRRNDGPVPLLRMRVQPDNVLNAITIICGPESVFQRQRHHPIFEQINGLGYLLSFDEVEHRNHYVRTPTHVWHIIEIPGSEPYVIRNDFSIM